MDVVSALHGWAPFRLASQCTGCGGWHNEADCEDRADEHSGVALLCEDKLAPQPRTQLPRNEGGWGEPQLVPARSHALAKTSSPELAAVGLARSQTAAMSHREDEQPPPGSTRRSSTHVGFDAEREASTVVKRRPKSHLASPQELKLSPELVQRLESMKTGPVKFTPFVPPSSFGILAKVTRIKQNLMTLIGPSIMELDRGVRFSPNFDNYSVSKKTSTVQRIHASVFHYRATLHNWEEDDQEMGECTIVGDSCSDMPSVSDCSTPTPSDSLDSPRSPKSPKPSSPPRSPRGSVPARRASTHRGSNATTEEAQSPPRSPRSPGAPRASRASGRRGSNGSGLEEDGEPRSPRSPDRSPRGSIAAKRSSRRRSTTGSDGEETPSPARRGSTGDGSRSEGRRRTSVTGLEERRDDDAKQEVVVRWAVIIGKIINTKVLDVTVMAGQIKHKRSHDISCTRLPVFESVRQRAAHIVMRARELSKRLVRETEDVYDCDWKPPENLMAYLFSVEYTDVLAMLANTARKILTVQPTLAEAKIPCRIFGDIHGQFRDLLLFFKAFGSPDEQNAPTFVFNGDFVDRGSHQVETIGLLLALKVMLPEKVCLIRGNHEDRWMNKRYGFHDECIKKMGKGMGPKVFEMMHNAFDQLPLACLVGQRILVLHGGIGDGAWRLEDLYSVKRPLKPEDLARPENNWIFNMLWSDPIEDDDDRGHAVFGVHDMPGNRCRMQFGWDVTKTFCARNGLSLVVRSHQSKQDSLGIDVMHDNQLVRVFSARDYEGHENDGATLLIEEITGKHGRSPGDLRGPMFKVRPQVLSSASKALAEQAEKKREETRQRQGSKEKPRSPRRSSSKDAPRSPRSPASPASQALERRRSSKEAPEAIGRARSSTEAPEAAAASMARRTTY